jgi:hypothetical protein
MPASCRDAPLDSCTPKPGLRHRPPRKLIERLDNNSVDPWDQQLHCQKSSRPLAAPVCDQAAGKSRPSLLPRDPRTSQHVQAPLIQMREQRGANSNGQNYEKQDHLSLLRHVRAGSQTGFDRLTALPLRGRTFEIRRAITTCPSRRCNRTRVLSLMIALQVNSGTINKAASWRTVTLWDRSGG